MENHEEEDVASAPFLKALARHSARYTRFYATTHPSLPNYLALLAGDTFGVHSDCTSCRVASTSLVDQLEGAHISWRAYMEGMPTPCYRGAFAGRYAKKHDPFMYFDRVVLDPARCRRVVPLTYLEGDLAQLPNFVWITPDLCHDMHDCSVRTGDDFLARLVPRLESALGSGGILFVTFDEGKTSAGCCGAASGGHIYTVATGGGVRPGTYGEPADHYSILRAVEEAFGLPLLRKAATAPPLGGLGGGAAPWRTGPPEAPTPLRAPGPRR